MLRRRKPTSGTDASIPARTVPQSARDDSWAFQTHLTVLYVIFSLAFAATTLYNQAVSCDDAPGLDGAHVRWQNVPALAARRPIPLREARVPKEDESSRWIASSEQILNEPPAVCAARVKEGVERGLLDGGCEYARWTAVDGPSGEQPPRLECEEDGWEAVTASIS